MAQNVAQGLMPSQEKMAKKAIMLSISTAEGGIVIFIALIFYVINLVLFALSFAGVGIPIEWLVDGLEAFFFGTWAILKPIMRAVTEKAVSGATHAVAGVTVNKVSNPSESNPGAEKIKETAQKGKQAVKAGVSVGTVIFSLFLTIITSFIPFIGPLIPEYVIFSIIQLVQDVI